MDDSGWSSEDHNADRNVDSKGQALEVLVTNKDIIRNRTQGDGFYNLVRNCVHVLRL